MVYGNSHLNLARKIILLMIIFLGISVFCLAVESGKSKVMRIKTDDKQIIRDLAAQQFDIAGINRQDHWIDIVGTDADEIKLQKLGFEYEIIGYSHPLIGTALADYYDPVEISAHMDQVQTNYPSIAKKILVKGPLYEGHNIYAMKISDNVNTHEDEAVVIIDGQHHAREVMGAEVPMDMIDYLTQRYATDPQVQNWVNNLEIYVIPSINPDGAWYMFNTDNNWRKNRHTGTCPINPTDINRNYSFTWNQCGGSSGTCTDDTYRGPSAQSEMEAQGYNDFYHSVYPIFLLSYHTYGEYIMWPYGCNDSNENAAYLEMGTVLNNTLVQDSGGTGGWATGPIWDTIYLVDGGSIDDTYGEMGTATFTIELNTGGFQPDYATWRNITVQRQRTSWQFMLDHAISTPSIQGHVTDCTTGSPLDSNVDLAEVTFTHGEWQRQSYAADFGRYFRMTQSNHDYHISFSKTGYVTKNRTMHVGSGTYLLDICLCPTSSLPNAPTGTTATATGTNQITVTWNSVSGVNCYNVYKSTGACPGGTFSVVSTCQTGTTYVDTAVSGGTTYSYQITSVVMPSTCESAFSTCAQATATGNCTLSPTFAGCATAASPGTSSCQINLTWAAAASNCSSGPNITYHIYRSTDPAFVPASTNKIAQCVTGTTYADTNVNYGTTYYYIVRSEDSTTTGTGPCNLGNIDTNLVRKSSAPVGPTTTLFSDNFEVSMANWTVSSRWTWATLYSHSTTHSAWSQDNTYQSCTMMTKTSMVALPSGSNPALHFWTAYNTESGYDGGIVEGSSNGTTFTKLALTPNYPGAVTGAVTCMAAQSAFSGNGAFTWAQYNSDLSAYAGGSFKMRFNYETDVSVNYGGWYVDDVSIDYGSACTTNNQPPGKLLNTLKATKTSGNPVLCWTAVGGTCTVTGYEIYRGNLPWTTYNHASLSCSASSCYTDSNAPNSYYYLVVSYNTTSEGSYGTQFPAGTERPQGSSPCRTQLLTTCN